MRSAGIGLLTGLVLALSGCCDPSAGGHRSVGTLAIDPLALGGEIDAAAIETLMATEVIVLQSWQVRERALERRGIMEPFGATELDAVEGLGSALEVARMEGSTAFEVSVTSADPQTSAEACNAVMEAYLEYRLEQRLLPLVQQEQWLGEQVETLRQELAAADPTNLEDLATRRALYDKVVGELDEVVLERSLSVNDARIIDRCLIPIATP
jgi:uncharacterized protein involved in exopolysaccharide biosynthesis